MNRAQNRLKPLLLVALIYLLTTSWLADCQQDVNGEIAAQPATNFPYYLQSPLGPQQQQQQLQQELKPKQRLTSGRKLAEPPLGQVNVEQQQQIQVAEQTLKPIPSLSGQTTAQEEPANCFYGKQYFHKLDECLSRRPYPTMGLPAFKNEDLLVESANLGERQGCVFILNNGLFKNYQVAKYSFEGADDAQCFDGGRVKLGLQFFNITLAYLWTLRCLNRADQLLDDSTLDGAATEQTSGICVGSSQNFGFTSIQLTNIDARVELATDIYKNWRPTNVTVAMQTPAFNFAQSTARSSNNISDANYSDTSDTANNNSLLATNIKEFVFESLDGDELNWRYLHLFQNWSRNRLHTNFLDQYRRFLWISLQRCLAESSDRLPIKVMDVFKNQRYN